MAPIWQQFDTKVKTPFPASILLALNATVEAARALEAANELAEQAELRLLEVDQFVQRIQAT